VAISGIGISQEKSLEVAKLQGFFFSVVGSSTWARTRDLRINSPALYRLSYRGTASNYSLKIAMVSRADAENADDFCEIRS
jgi:hypothetical protein